MKLVDEVPELVGRAEPGRRRVVRGHLVAPGSAVRVLGHRHELDVREPARFHIRNEGIGELGVRKPEPPRAEMDLVHAHRLAQRVPPTAGTNSSHTPEPPSERIGCARPSQWLNSPIIRTPRALGAQTANDVPSSSGLTRAPRT